ncbi:MAG: hypothetical protein B2I17_02045 [Thermoplasmatales archaeon B_DKE]|nr:MAG: hypothetical protein B2I17_02045 [Thermoplasmatales archaeon B_DKE]
MKFLMPLRRNPEGADYGMHMGSTFMYRNMGILSGFSSSGRGRVHMFYMIPSLQARRHPHSYPLYPMVKGNNHSTMLNQGSSGRSPCSATSMMSLSRYISCTSSRKR